MKDRAVDPLAARRIVWGVLGLMLLAALADIPNRRPLLELVPPVARLWADPDAQYRAQVAPAPYDLLRKADALLPPDAPVLLVTSGADIADEEYVTFHRALYFLAPCPVWWMAPAPADGTWKARWWISALLTPESVRAVAAAKGAAYILTYKLGAPLAVGRQVADLGDGELRQLPGAAPPTDGPPRQPLVAGAAWPFQLAAALGVLLLLGRLVLAGAAQLGYQPGPVETWGLAWVLGAGPTTVAMLWLGALGLSLPLQIAVLTAVALLGIVFRGYPRPDGPLD